MKSLRYISIQPRLIFYAWQVEVMLNNFISKGINPKNIDILVACNTNDPRTSSEEHKLLWDKLVKHFSDVNFYFYDDKRNHPVEYVSTIRPNIFKQHLQKYTELSKDVFFYSDCDMIFSKKPNFDNLLNDDYWYVSDTNSYINAEYILSKGEEVYFKMCDIVGIDEAIPIQNNRHSGGAQYIMKNLTWQYWDKVEKDSENLFSEITKLNNKIKETNADYHELQIWCADMWAVLWNGWLFGNNIKIDKRLNFSWATDNIDVYKHKKIYHNAGVSINDTKLFLKSSFTDILPYNYIDKKMYSKDFCSIKYVQEILKTKKVSCLL